MRGEGDDPCTPSLAGSSGPRVRHRPRLERRSAVGLSRSRAAGRAAGGSRADGRHPRGAYHGLLSGCRADPAVAFGPDDRLLVRSRHSGRGRDRPRDRSGRSLGRPEPGPSLAHQPSSLAVPRRRRAHCHGHGGGGDAAPLAFGRGARRAAGRRLAALVRAPARAAGRPTACRNRSRRRDRPGAVLCHGALDDGLDLRSSA